MASACSSNECSAIFPPLLQRSQARSVRVSESISFHKDETLCKSRVNIAAVTFHLGVREPPAPPVRLCSA